MQHHISDDCILNQRKYLAMLFETVGKILVGNTVIWTPEEFLVCWTVHFWQSKQENKVEGNVCVCVCACVHACGILHHIVVKIMNCKTIAFIRKSQTVATLYTSHIIFNYGYDWFNIINA